MEKVWLLQHTHEFEDGHEDVKLIGIYSSRGKARAAKLLVANQPGFRSHPKGFSIFWWRLDDKPAWDEGFVTAYPGGTFSD